MDANGSNGSNGNGSNGHGRIHLLGDHREPKPTRAEAQFHQTRQMIEHYMVQIPGLMGQAIEAALSAYDAGRRDEFAAWVHARGGDMIAVVDLLEVFGPRRPMPDQPETPS